MTDEIKRYCERCGGPIRVKRRDARFCSAFCRMAAWESVMDSREKSRRIERDRKLRETAEAYLTEHPDFFETLAEVRNEYQSGTFRLWWELTRYTYGQCPSNNLMRFFKEWLEVIHDTKGQGAGAEEACQIAPAEIGVSPSGRLDTVLRDPGHDCQTQAKDTGGIR